MGISVNDFSADNLSGKVYSKYSTNEIDTNVTDAESSSYLDFEGYLKLLNSQMSNQDFNNAMSDSEFIQQMSSYSMMEAISDLTKQNAVTYASSLIGKAVTVTDGSGMADTGMVESVTVTGEGCKILVNGSLYSTESISDVVDGTVYTQLKSFVGHTVELKDGDEVLTGKVTGIVIKNGSGYVTIDNKFSYDMNAITNVIKPETEGEENAEGTVEGTESDTQADSSAQDNTQSAEVEESNAGTYNRGEVSGTVHSSEASFDTLMKMLDSANDEDNSPIEEAMRTARVNSRMSNMSRLLSADVAVQNAASGLSSDMVPAPRQYTGAPAPITNGQPEIAYNTQPQANAQSYQAQSNTTSYDRGDESGVVTVSGSNAQSTSVEQFINDAEYTEIPYSSRKYADEYPVEAAFADSVGTKMADIRFIGNQSVNSEIKTSPILCYSPSGRAVTDIGWCGKGRLGEVITFADGTQRVEIIGPTEVSYLYTSGRYTLDYICDYTIVDGSLQGKLDPFETAIRHYAKEYTEAEIKAMKEFEEYALWHARTQYGS